MLDQVNGCLVCCFLTNFISSFNLMFKITANENDINDVFVVKKL